MYSVKVELIAMWDIVDDGCMGFIIVSNEDKILMEQAKVYGSLKEFKGYIARAFCNNKRFEWFVASTYFIKKYIKLVGFDKGKDNKK